MTLILAASEFDVVIGIIFFLFWIVAAIAGKLKSTQNKQRPANQPPGESPLERVQREIAEQLRRMHGDALGPRPAPPAPPPLPQQAMQPPRTPQQQRRQPKQRPRPVQVFADVPPPVVPAAAPMRPMVSPTAVARPAVTADAIRRWMKPATLRQQFILTELFQPPMCMREQER